ncbi:unnamed protein product [Orchesella dallaii]
MKQHIEVRGSRAVRTGGTSQQQSPRRYHNRTSSALNEVNNGDASEAITEGSELIGMSSANSHRILPKPLHRIDCDLRHTNMNHTHSLIMDSEKLSKNYGVERKVSRIPRPTSASSKKCLTSKSNPKITNTSVNTPRTTRPAEVCPRSPLAKMGRSVSLVQPRKIQQPKVNDKYNLVSIGTETSSTSFCPSTPRPRSASSSTYPAKRQCAASFSTSTNNLRIVKPQINHNTSFKAPLTYRERFQNMKSGIPSTQDILSVISRESSELGAFKTFNQMHKPRYRAGGASSIPRRTYNITFDCPICIGSLVQSGTIDLREGTSKGNVVTHCGHLFHRECMENWLRIKGNNRCPICSTLCVPETLQSVYLECNVSVDENSKTILAKESCKFEKSTTANDAFEVLKSEYDILQTRYDEMLAENEEFSFKAAIASSLQSAYDMECRNRLQLQWYQKDKY